jgi:hypothetical protein
MSIIAQLKEKVTAYAEVYIKLLKVNFIERTSDILSYFIFSVICVFITFCILLFLGMGFSEFLTDAGLSKTAAVFITSGTYLLLLLIIIMLRKQIVNFFAAIFVRIMTEADKKPEDDDDDEE